MEQQHLSMSQSISFELFKIINSIYEIELLKIVQKPLIFFYRNIAFLLFY